MSSTHPYQPPNVVYRPSRGDQRIVRQILANLSDGVPCADIENIACGSLARVVRFLAAVRGLIFVFIAHGPEGAAFAFCGPDAASAAAVGRSALELPPPFALPSPPGPGNLFAGSEGRVAVLRDAVERIVMALHDREDCLFALVWCINGESCAAFEHSYRLRRETAIEWVRWFLSEKLQASTPFAPNLAAHP